MNLKRFVLASSVIFIFAILWNGVIHMIILREVDSILTTIGRPENDRNVSLSLLVTLLLSLLFVWSYARFARRGTVTDGLCHGLFFGILAGVLVDLNQYVLYPIPASLALKWFFFGLLEFGIYGILVSKLFPVAPRAA